MAGCCGATLSFATGCFVIGAIRDTLMPNASLNMKRKYAGFLKVPKVQTKCWMPNSASAV